MQSVAPPFEEVEISVAPIRESKIDRDSAKRYADLGVTASILLHRTMMKRPCSNWLARPGGS